MKRNLAFLILALLTAVPLSAQTVLSATTTSAAIADSAVQQMTVTSTTGFTAPGTGSAAVLAVIDREIVAVRTVNTTTKIIGIARGQNGTRATPHVSGATVTVGPPRAFYSYVPSGQCTRTNLEYVPWVVGGGAGLGIEVGTLWDCLGVTTAGQWVQVNGPGLPVSGSAVASATSITPTGTFFVVSGTVNPVNTIVVPAGWATGMCLNINPSGVFVTGTGGNINLATTAVVNKILTMCWDGTKWEPSY